VTCAASTGVSVTGGVATETGNTKMYLGEAMNKDGLKFTMTSQSLSDVLASGKVTDNSGVEYKYDQYIELKGKTTTFDTHGGDIDPTTYISIGTSSAAPLYSAKVVFSKPLDVASTDKSLGKAITLFGKEYTITSDAALADNTQVVIFSTGTEVGLQWDGNPVTQTVTAGGHTFTVTLNGITTANEADMTIDGTSYIRAKSASVTASGVSFFVKESSRYGTGATGRVVLSVGGERLLLKDAQTVKKGTDETSVSGTLVTVTSGGVDKISAITVDSAATSSTSDYLAEGGSFTDPVFGFKVAYNGLVPVAKTAGEKLDFGVSGEKGTTLLMTDSKGNTKTINVGYDADPTDGSNNPTLADINGKAYIVTEGAAIAREEYVILNSGGFPRLFKFTDFTDETVNSGTITDKATITLTDQFTSEALTFELTETAADTDFVVGDDKYIDGQKYSMGFVGDTTDKLYITWGATAASSDTAVPTVGGRATLFPTLETKYGAKVALANKAALGALPLVENATALVFELPTGLVRLDDDATSAQYAVSTDGGTTWGTTTDIVAGTDVLANITVGRVVYQFQVDSVAGGNSDIDNVKLFDLIDATNNVNSVGVLVVEEKDVNSAKNAVAVGAQTTDGYAKAEWSAPKFTDTAFTPAAKSWKSDSYKTSYMDFWGTLAERNTQDQDKLSLYYPDEQVRAIVAVGSAPVFTAGAAGQTVATQSIAPIKTMVGKLDTEFLALSAADQQAKNVISVGGPAVNRVTAALLGKTFPAYGADSGLTANTALIKLVENAFSGSKVALVVAGWEAINTRAATSALQNFETAALTGTEKVL